MKKHMHIGSRTLNQYLKHAWRTPDNHRWLTLGKTARRAARGIVRHADRVRRGLTPVSV